MKSTQDRELAGPPLAERARTLAARSRTATVVAAGATDRPMPILYQVHRDRTAVLLLAMDRALPTLAEVAPGGEVSAMLELSDVAPVTMREPVRGLLWITGWLRCGISSSTPPTCCVASSSAFPEHDCGVAFKSVRWA